MSDMKRALYPAAALLALLLPVTACHRDNETTTTTPSLNGTLTFDLPTYVRPGETYKMVPTGVSHPGGGRLAYTWDIDVIDFHETVRQQDDPAEVDSSYTFTIPADLGSYTVKCSASASDYYSTTGSRTYTSVDPQWGGSLTGSGIDPDADPYVTDARDDAGPAGENRYYYATIGGTDWFRHNLAYTGSGTPYLDEEALNYVTGRFYTYEEAVSACPDGWHLPDTAEWRDMVNTVTGGSFGGTDTFTGAAGTIMGDVYFNGAKMWEFWPQVRITDASGLSAIPAGYFLHDGEGSFYGLNSYAAFWTASTVTGDDTQAYYRYINVNQPDIYLGRGDKASFGASVRCVRDSVQ